MEREPTPAGDERTTAPRRSFAADDVLELIAAAMLCPLAWLRNVTTSTPALPSNDNPQPAEPDISR